MSYSTQILHKTTKSTWTGNAQRHLSLFLKLWSTIWCLAELLFQNNSNWDIGLNLLNFLNITHWAILKKSVNKNFVSVPMITVKNWWTFHCPSILKILVFIVLKAKLNSWSAKTKNIKLNTMKMKIKKWIKKDKIFSSQFMAFLDLTSFKAELKLKTMFKSVTKRKIKNAKKRKTTKITLECDLKINHWKCKNNIYHGSIKIHFELWLSQWYFTY